MTDKGIKGPRKKSNLSRAAVLMSGSVRMRIHVSYIPTQGCSLIDLGKNTTSTHTGGNGRLHRIQEEAAALKAYGSVTYSLTLGKSFNFLTVSFLMYKNRHNSISLKELLRDLN